MEQMIVQVERFSDKVKKIKLTLSNGETVIGKSQGIEPESDIEGNSLGYCVLNFKVDGLYNPLYLKNEDIFKYEEA